MRWIGFLGSWALLVLALGLATFAVAGEMINVRDTKRLERVEVIDRMIAERSGGKTEALRKTAQERAAELATLQSKVAKVAHDTEDVPDSKQTIMVSTAENRVYVRQNGQTIFQAVCSTGKGTTMAMDGKTLIFDTPIGKFHVKSKEENPMWVPPDWHYVEMARKNGMNVIRLNPGASIDAGSGQLVHNRDEGVWSWFGGDNRSGSRVLKVKNNTVVEESNGSESELPPGKVILAGNTIVIPPVGTPQRRFDKVLGHYRLNLGDGYALHGTQETDKLGQSVSHGCVRLGDDDIAHLFQITNVGDEVIIY
jgi:lipoprotein-anchoring transpeptidase ErfK/SrfK